MQRKLITPDIDTYPAVFHTFMKDAAVYDSSCSPMARVVFIDKDQGYYLKSAKKGSLKREAELTRFFHRKGLATEVLAYVSDERDWLLTARVAGEDCTDAVYLSDPKRLCDTTAKLLRELHSVDPAGCPVPNRTANYIQTATYNYHNGIYDATLFPDNWGYRSAVEAFTVIKECGNALKTDTLLHGDYCLPNIMLDNWKFSGFIDLDNGGVGDRHVDLFWGAWTLFFNLKTDKYRERFLDAYGRDKVNEDILKLIAAIEVFG